MTPREHRKHIVIICPSCGGTGAVANVALHHAKELSNKFRATLLSDNFPEEKYNGVVFLEMKPWNFSWLRRFSHVLREFAFAREAGRCLKQLDWADPIDIVMCHGHAVAALAAKPLKENIGVPYAMVTHGDIFDRPKGTYDPRLTWFYKKVTPTAYQNSDLVIALSPYMKKMAIRGGADPARVEIIPNGIDPEEIGLDDGSFPPQISIDEHRLELLYLGRLSVEKGVDILIEACGLLKKEGVEFRLRIAGDGPERVSLDDRIKALKLQTQIVFLGHVSRRELGSLYRSTHLVCVPSRSDSLPTVILESYASGTPVIGSDTGGIPFLIQENKIRCLFPTNNSDAMGKLIKEIAVNPQCLVEMRTACLDLARKNFSWKSNRQTLVRKIIEIEFVKTSKS